MANEGVKTVLFGDSLTDFWEYSPTVTATYDHLTGIVTFTYTNHGLWTGAIGRFWCFTYTETAKARRLPLTRVNADTLTMTLADKPTLAPTLTGSVFLKAGGANQYISWVGMMQMLPWAATGYHSQFSTERRYYG